MTIVNPDFREPGPTPGSALGWTLRTHVARTRLWGFGTTPMPAETFAWHGQRDPAFSPVSHKHSFEGGVFAADFEDLLFAMVPADFGGPLFSLWTELTSESAQVASFHADLTTDVSQLTLYRAHFPVTGEYETFWHGWEAASTI